MPRVVHFEIHADDPARAVEFYSKVFGWVFQKWDGPHDYWMITTGDPEAPGINGGLIKRMGPPPGDCAAVGAYPCTGPSHLNGEETLEVTFAPTSL